MATEKVASDRRFYFLDLKENRRGRFVKITEDVDGRRRSIIVPSDALSDFVDALSRLAQFESMLE